MTPLSRWLVAALAAASFLSGVEVRAGGLTIRPEQVVGPAVLALVFVGRRRISFPRLAFPVLLWITVGALGAVVPSAPFAPGLDRALVHTLRLLATVLPLVLIPALVESDDGAARAWDIWLLLCVAEGVVALAALASHLGFGTTVGVTVENALGFAHPRGTLIEPNVLGALSAAGAAALFLRAASGNETPRRRVLAAMGAAVLLATVAVSVTRAAWIALPLALAASFLLRLAPSPRRLARPLLLAAGVTTIALVLLLVVDAGGRTGSLLDTRTGVAGRVAALASPADDPNVAVRMKSYRAALGIWSERPWLGAGHGAMERIAAPEDFELAWAGNLEIHLLADTGLAGLALFLGFAGVVLVRTARNALGPDGSSHPHLESLAALLVLLVSAQTTETSWLSAFWVLFGLAVAGNEVRSESRSGVPSVRRLKVLYVHPSDELYGSDRVLLELVRHLDRTRVEPLVLLSTDVPYRGLLGHRLEAEGVRVVRFPIAVLRRRILASLSLFTRYLVDFAGSTVRIVRLIGAERVDLVHANTVTVLPAVLAALWTGQRLVWHIHEIVPERFGKGLLARLVLLAADHAVAVSSAARTALSPREDPRLIVIPNGVADLGASPPPSSPPVVSFIGRLSERKGPQVFLAAALRLVRRFPEVRFVLAGDEPFGSEELTARLHDQARHEELQNRVIFRPFREETSDLYAEASVVVSPSLLPESFGLVILEAMAAARPVVASSVGGPAELIVDGENGFLVPPGDAEALADAIGRLLEDPERRRRMGEAGRKRALDCFPIEKTAARFGQLYALSC